MTKSYFARCQTFSHAKRCGNKIWFPHYCLVHETCAQAKILSAATSSQCSLSAARPREIRNTLYIDVWQKFVLQKNVKSLWYIHIWVSYEAERFYAPHPAPCNKVFILEHTKPPVELIFCFSRGRRKYRTNYSPFPCILEHDLKFHCSDWLTFVQGCKMERAGQLLLTSARNRRRFWIGGC